MYHTLHEVINEVPVDTRVNVRGLVMLSDTKTVIVGQNQVPIREGYIVDETGQMKITLWQEYTGIENGKTYDFLQLSKIRYGSQVILQSVHLTSYHPS